MIKHLSLKAYGKINLGLDVLRRREDGYHDVRMVMQTLYLYDNVTLQKKSAPGIEIDSNLFYLPNDEESRHYACLLQWDNIYYQEPTEEYIAPKTTVRALLDQLSQIVADQLENGGEITLPGIGKLKVTERPARTGRNPSTGAAIEIAAKKVIKLVVAKGLTDAVNK